jgi:hypothetical protein
MSKKDSRTDKVSRMSASFLGTGIGEAHKTTIHKGVPPILKKVSAEVVQIRRPATNTARVSRTGDRRVGMPSARSGRGRPTRMRPPAVKGNTLRRRPLE